MEKLSINGLEERRAMREKQAITSRRIERTEKRKRRNRAICEILIVIGLLGFAWVTQLIVSTI